jgi:hydrogenase-4 component B
MAVLAILALVIGFLAGPVTSMLSGLVSELGIFSAEPAFYSDTLKVGLQDGFAAVSMPLILASLAGILLLTFVTVSMVTRNRKVEIKRTWDCGTTPDSRMEITATGFARSIITVFKGVLRTTRNVSVKDQNGGTRYFGKSRTVEFGIRDIYKTYFYHPVSVLATKASEQVKKIQSGNVSMYILYIIIALVVLLLIESI